MKTYPKKRKRIGEKPNFDGFLPFFLRFDLEKKVCGPRKAHLNPTGTKIDTKNHHFQQSALFGPHPWCSPKKMINHGKITEDLAHKMVESLKEAALTQNLEGPHILKDSTNRVTTSIPPTSSARARTETYLSCAD